MCASVCSRVLRKQESPSPPRGHAQSAAHNAPAAASPPRAKRGASVSFGGPGKLLTTRAARALPVAVDDSDSDGDVIIVSETARATLLLAQTPPHALSRLASPARGPACRRRPREAGGWREARGWSRPREAGSGGDATLAGGRFAAARPPRACPSARRRWREARGRRRRRVSVSPAPALRRASNLLSASQILVLSC